MMLTPDYFDRLYASNEDPWGFRERWYEQRKRDLTLAVLPRPHYASIFEPGCSIGELSVMLAQRCDSLFSCDVSEAAVDSARKHLANYAHARVEKRSIVEGWPDESFDLIVVSELGYYFDAKGLRLLIKRAVASLGPGGTLLACHWRPGVHDYPLSGTQVHEHFNRFVELPRLLRHEENDFLLELWSYDPRSVAQTEGLV